MSLKKAKNIVQPNRLTMNNKKKSTPISSLFLIEAADFRLLSPVGLTDFRLILPLSLSLSLLELGLENQIVNSPLNERRSSAYMQSVGGLNGIAFL